MGWERVAPKVVVQKNNQCCWAGALEAWMSVTPTSPASWFIKTQDDALKHYKPFLMSEEGGLDVTGRKFKKDANDPGWVGGVEFMAAGVGMGLKVFKKASAITGAFLYEKLKGKGHLYFMFGQGTIGHAAVIYKIVHPLAPTKCVLSMMDPWPGKGLITRTLAEVQANNEAVIGWPEKS
jgi:hypothetical protein